MCSTKNAVGLGFEMKRMDAVRISVATILTHIYTQLSRTLSPSPDLCSGLTNKTALTESSEPNQSLYMMIFLTADHQLIEIRILDLLCMLNYLEECSRILQLLQCQIISQRRYSL